MDLLEMSSQCNTEEEFKHSLKEMGLITKDVFKIVKALWKPVQVILEDSSGDPQKLKTELPKGQKVPKFKEHETPLDFQRKEEEMKILIRRNNLDSKAAAWLLYREMDSPLKEKVNFEPKVKKPIDDNKGGFFRTSQANCDRNQMQNDNTTRAFRNDAGGRGKSKRILCKSESEGKTGRF